MHTTDQIEIIAFYHSDPEIRKKAGLALVEHYEAGLQPEKELQEREFQPVIEQITADHVKGEKPQFLNEEALDKLSILSVNSPNAEVREAAASAIIRSQEKALEKLDILLDHALNNDLSKIGLLGIRNEVLLGLFLLSADEDHFSLETRERAGMVVVEERGKLLDGHIGQLRQLLDCDADDKHSVNLPKTVISSAKEKLLSIAVEFANKPDVLNSGKDPKERTLEKVEALRAIALFHPKEETKKQAGFELVKIFSTRLQKDEPELPLELVFLAADKDAHPEVINEACSKIIEICKTHGTASSSLLMKFAGTGGVPLKIREKAGIMGARECIESKDIPLLRKAASDERLPPLVINFINNQLKTLAANLADAGDLSGKHKDFIAGLRRGGVHPKSNIGTGKRHPRPPRIGS
jgi:hypothetical protein